MWINKKDKKGPQRYEVLKIIVTFQEKKMLFAYLSLSDYQFSVLLYLE